MKAGRGKGRGKKAVVLLAGIAATAVAVAAAISWRAILEEIEYGRICRDPARLLAIADRPEGSPARRAIRRYLRGEPDLRPEASGEEVPPSVPPQKVDRIPGDAKVRAVAPSLEAIIAATNPSFSWNGGDLAWIEGWRGMEPVAVFARAFEVESGPADRRWVLFDVIARGKATEVARRTGAGTIVRVDWVKSDSFGESKSRSIFIHRRESGDWRFIGEIEPSILFDQDLTEIAWEGPSGVSLRFQDDVGGNSVTYILPGGREVTLPSEPRFRMLTIEAGGPVRQGREYVIARAGDSVFAIASRLDQVPDPIPEVPRIICIELLQLNRDLPDGPIPAGTRIWLPQGEDRFPWWDRILPGILKDHAE